MTARAFLGGGRRGLGKRATTPEERIVLLAEREFRERVKRGLLLDDGAVLFGLAQGAGPTVTSRGAVLPGLPVPADAQAVPPVQTGAGLASAADVPTPSPMGRDRPARIRPPAGPKTSPAPGEGSDAGKNAEASFRESHQPLSPALSPREREAPPEPAAAPEPSAVPDPASVAGLLAETPPGDRHALIARLYRAFEGQVAQLEARLTELLGQQGSGSLTEIDQTVKTLASLAKTLTLLIDLAKEQGEGDRDHDSLDPDSLRAQLAQRLGRLGQDGTG